MYCSVLILDGVCCSRAVPLFVDCSGDAVVGVAVAVSFRCCPCRAVGRDAMIGYCVFVGGYCDICWFFGIG